MISQLRGTLLEATAAAVVLDVSGVGFELGVSGATAAMLPQIGKECRLYTRMQVREDAMTLFGFATKEERTMFDRLVSITGVGPRLALAVLSKYSVSQLYSIVMAEDEKSMSSVSGVGKRRHSASFSNLKASLRRTRDSYPPTRPRPFRLALLQRLRTPRSMTRARPFCPWASVRKKPSSRLRVLMAL